MTTTTRRYIFALGLPLLGGALYACGSSSDTGATGIGTKSGGSCAKDADCASGSCVSGVCATGSNLADGKSCSAASECASGACTNNVCGTGPSGMGGSGTGGGATGSGGSGTETGGTGTNAGGTGTTGGNPVGSPCTASSECQSGLCANGTCTAPTGGGTGTVTTGPHWDGTGSSFRPLTAGCGPATASDCTGACEKAGGDPNVQIIRPPATLCFSSPDDLTPNDPAVVIEQSIETLNGVSYVHLRVTFDPSFVDNTYGTNSAPSWHLRGGPHIYGHTFDPDLVKSDHTELLITDGTGATVTNVHVDYISPDPTEPCGYGSLGVLGGDGSVTSGDPTKILAVTTSLDRNLNGCGYCKEAACSPTSDCTIDSPVTTTDLKPNTETPNWDYRMVYELWIDASAFGTAGFGQAYMTYVHASPNKSTLVTLNVKPTPCPPSWDTPYCPPSVVSEGASCFGAGGSGGQGGAAGSAGAAGAAGSAGSSGAGGTTGMVPRGCPVNYQIYVSSEGASTCTPIPFANYPGFAACPAGYTLDVVSEGRYCLPTP